MSWAGGKHTPGSAAQVSIPAAWAALVIWGNVAVDCIDTSIILHFGAGQQD